VRQNGQNPATFITVPLSHYCEKARWALDRLAIPYREHAHLPLLHRLATMRRGGGTVPVFVHGLRRLTDSTDILVYADALRGGDMLYPRHASLRRDVETLEERFDRGLGPSTRRWAYAHLLPEAKLVSQVWSRGVPRLEARLLPVIAPIARRLARAAYRITPESARLSHDRVHGVFREMDDRLRDGRRFLVGERFTAADLSFAALAAPVLFPAGCRATLPPLDAVPAAMREEVLRLRDTDSGQFGLRLYEDERDRIAATPAASR
jgi:glutathione S-transferase